MLSETVKIYDFPSNFIWAVATSAYQIEGAANDDGRGPSIWDMFSKAGKSQNHTGCIACDSYHNWKRDIEMIKELGVQQYRFSISWPRILPDGTLKIINQKGVEYYKNLINGLIEVGIEPNVTLFHWDLPQSLQDQGGFINPKIVDYFVDYCQFCFETFGDKIKLWTTFNEPIVFTLLGHSGYPFHHAPGGFMEHSDWIFYLTNHHILLAHAKTVDIYRNKFQEIQKGKIGIVLVIGDFYPATENPEDVEAADNMREFFLGLYAHPILIGDYPELIKNRVWNVCKKQGRITSRLPEFTSEEINKLKGSADFIGVNYYFSFKIRALTLEESDVFKNDARKIDIGGHFAEWMSSHPEGCRTALARFKKDYGNIPIMITENGVKDSDNQKSNLEDDERINYIQNHLISVHESINKDKVNVIGYTYWSLMDNFEWSYGYHARYGLYHVNFNDPKRTRTPKKSAEYFKNIVFSNKIIKNLKKNKL